MPNIAIGKPQAAEVATALRMAILCQFRKGTVSVPPPMPAMAETAPMIKPPMADSILLSEMVCCRLWWFHNKYSAMVTSKTPNTGLSMSVFISLAAMPPSHAPRNVTTFGELKGPPPRAWSGVPFAPLNYRLTADEVERLAEQIAPALLSASAKSDAGTAGMHSLRADLLNR